MASKTATNKTWAVFQTHLKAADLDNRLIETAGTAGYRGAANLTTTLATTQAALITSKLILTITLTLALQSKFTPSITPSSNLSDISPVIGKPSAQTY
jgi:hypothetical protein